MLMCSQQPPRRLSTMRPAGVLLFWECKLPEAELREYLTVEQRASYLVDKGYAVDGVISDGIRSLLRTMNFHYFLGYARNYRALVNSGRVDGDISLDRLARIITLDREFSNAMFAGIGELEWALRAALVEAHCSLHPARGCFLQEEHYRPLDIAGRPTHLMVREQSLRSREPFIIEQFEMAAGRKLSHAEIDGLAEGLKDEVLGALPIWSLVDGWTIGLLGRVVMASKSPAGLEEEFLWKRVAAQLEVSNAIFPTQIEALVVIRNQLAHHSRMWMRPTNASPKLPKLYRRPGRDAQNKSMYVGVLALASFLRARGTDGPFLQRVDAILASDPVFALGIKSPILEQ